MDKFYFYSGLLIAAGLSWFLLSVRKKSWCSNSFRFGITGLLFIIGFICLISIENPTKYQRSFFIWLQIPIINSLADRFFKLLSFSIHKRDLLLYIKGSDDLYFQGKKNFFKPSDYLFSIILGILLVVLPMIGILI